MREREHGAWQILRRYESATQEARTERYNVHKAVHGVLVRDELANQESNCRRTGAEYERIKRIDQAIGANHHFNANHN